MQHKTVIITGANSGIGKATAIALAKKGAHIVMVCRNPEKGAAAQKEIIAASKSNKVAIHLCDFSSQQQIRQAAATLQECYPKIDVLLNNAGMIMHEKQLTEDGLEMTFAVDHLGYFLFTNLLLDTLRNTPNARIINVASEAHRMVSKIDWDNLQAEKKFSQWGSYGLAKLGNILFTYELAHQLNGTGITVNCLHPGVVSTNFGQTGGWLKHAMSLISWFLISPEKGAETSIYLASSPDVATITGKYFDKKKASKSSALSYDKAVAKKLWNISAKLTGLVVSDTAQTST